MRISTNQFHAQSFGSINKHQNDLLDIQEKLSTGKRVNKPSDDPVASYQIHALNRTMNTILQYEKNGQYAKSQLDYEETQINSAVDISQRARELTIQMMNETYTAEQRQATAVEIGGLINHLANLMNSSNSEGELLFAGSNVGVDKAFVVDNANSGPLQTNNKYFAYIGSANAGADFDQRANFGARFIQIGFDADNKVSPDDEGDPSRVRVTDNGGRVFGIEGSTSLPAGVDKSLINVLVQLKDNLDQGLQPPAEIGEDLLSSIKEMSVQLSKIGSRQNRIEAQSDSGKAFSLSLEERRSSIEDQDVVEGISQLTRNQTALQMAQQVFVKVQSMSLFNYMN
jgi:flagellar hook-associated protein 3 FlgL